MQQRHRRWTARRSGPSPALGEQAQALAVPPQHLDQVALPPAEHEGLAENGSRARWSWTRAASPSKPLRMSVCPVASQTREPDGTGVHRPSSAAIAPCRSARSAPAAAAPDARPIARSRSGPAQPAPRWSPGPGAAGERDEGRRGSRSRGCCSASKARRHRNSRLECRPCRRATSEAVVAGSSASARIGASAQATRRGGCPCQAPIEV